MKEYEPMEQQIQQVMQAPGGSVGRYANLVIGEPSWGKLLRHEFLTGLFGSWPGAAGYALRRCAWRPLFEHCGRNVTFGRNVTLRGAGRIRLGDGVVLDDNVVLDARGALARIEIGDGALLSRNTIVRNRGKLLKIGAGSDVGANCILATDSRLEIGRDVLIAAFTYISAGGRHRYDRPDVPMIRQGFESRGGVVLEDDIWIGAHTTILDGVRIGAGSIVGAHSLVNASLEPRSIAWGVPARKQQSRPG
jgi:acetyltransferase-like isoleucine patch superfamily enzyme